MSIRELETLTGADSFVQQLSSTALQNVLKAIVRSKYLGPTFPPKYTPAEAAEIEHSLKTGEGIVSAEDYLKSCEAKDRD